MSVTSSEETQRFHSDTFEVYRSEGDAHRIKKKFPRAILCYTKALEKKDGDAYCFLKRSQCHLLNGNANMALADANDALRFSPENYKGLLQKAEALYTKGNFEKSLVYFHRGYNKRPTFACFRLGIQKCEKAIRNSLANPTAIKMTSSEGQYISVQCDEEIDRHATLKAHRKGATQTNSDDVPLHILHPSRARVIFGHLHDVHEYLQQLMYQESSKRTAGKSSEELCQIARDCLHYLDDRSKFWHQEKPLYSRRKPKQVKPYKHKKDSNVQGTVVYRVLQRLHEIDEYQHSEEHSTAIKLAEGLRHEMEQWSEGEFPNRLEILANVNSMLGLSQLETNQYDEALESHVRAYELGQQCNMPEIMSHAVDNIGRVHAKRGDYQSAINVWEKKLNDCSDELELIWLRYELGRCELELKRSELALEHGDQALELARKVGDESWQLNLNVLIGQANLNLQHRKEARTAFRKAYELAKDLNAGDAEKAILEVMNELPTSEGESCTENKNSPDIKSKPIPTTLHVKPEATPAESSSDQ